MRRRELLNAAERRDPDEFAAADRASPRLSTVAPQAASKQPRIDLVAGERMAISSAESAGLEFDKPLLLKVGLVVLGLLAFFGLASLGQRFLGL